jgi:hypothetical protein
MPQGTRIEWTEATWNPVTGCTKVSAGCAHCYAQTFAERWRGISGHPYEQSFDLRLWPGRLEVPRRWTARRGTGPALAHRQTDAALEARAGSPDVEDEAVEDARVEQRGRGRPRPQPCPTRAGLRLALT